MGPNQSDCYKEVVSMWRWSGREVLCYIKAFAKINPVYFPFSRVLTALSSMVLPAVPSSSVVAVVMILTTISIPTFHIGLLFTVEWFL